MSYDKAIRFGRATPSSIVKAAARAVIEPRKPMTPEQKHRARFMNECRMKELQEYIDQCSGKPQYFRVVARWREELIQLHEQF